MHTVIESVLSSLYFKDVAYKTQGTVISIWYDIIQYVLLWVPCSMLVPWYKTVIKFSMVLYKVF